MDPLDEIKEDIISDPLKHLLSLDWNPTAKVDVAEKNLEHPKCIKRVRFSDEVKQISYDIADENSFYNNGKSNNDTDNFLETNSKLSVLPDENNTSIYSQEAEIDLLNCDSSFVDVENTFDSITADKEKSTSSCAEIDNLEVEAIQDCTDGNVDNINFLTNSETELKNNYHELKTELHDLNEVTNEIRNMPLNDIPLEEITSTSLKIHTQEHSDCSSISNGDCLEIKELKSNDAGLSNISSKERVNIELPNQKQSWKLNTVLTKISVYTSATELNSAVFKAWCDIKNKTKDVKTSDRSKIISLTKPVTSNKTYLTWKKSKAVSKKATKNKQDMNFPDMQQEVSKNTKEEIELAFKAWKRKKDEVLKQRIVEKFNKDEQLNIASMMDKNERKMEADAAFSAWKEHKLQVIKEEKKRMSWILQKKQEDDYKKILRDKEALKMYHMWLENKNSLPKCDTFNLVMEKPPWFPPGKYTQKSDHQPKYLHFSIDSNRDLDDRLSVVAGSTWK
ncbi:uncharacterized protein CDAR_563521 [Caerostris darwini]|uniref:Uncharacterized protein n=1 Tax=Caerostris darwini TaxID=1538125 RepID=A0AAV4VXB1_9ARAC|nr:uncharacterized protein CDAR_563521 [Caerostris darwini]